MSVIAIWRGLPVRGSGLWHFGVLIANLTVIHFVRPEHGGGKCVLNSTSYADFVQPKETTAIHPVYDVPVKGQFTKQRIGEIALRELAKGGYADKYNLLYNNCESFAMYCATGAKKSSQVNKMVQVGIGAMVLASLLPLLFFILCKAFDHEYARRDWRNFLEKQGRKVDWDSVGPGSSELEKVGKKLFEEMGPTPELEPGYEDPRENVFLMMDEYGRRPSTWTVGTGSAFIAVFSVGVMHFLPLWMGWSVREELV